MDLQNPLKAAVEKRWERYLKEGVLETADLSFCTVPLSLFADLECILRRLYVFAEEPCKSTTTTSEPCSPVFKEAQPRPSGALKLEYHTNNLNLYMYVFGLFIIYCNKSIQPDCDKIKGFSVLLLETPLTRSEYIFPIHTRTTSYANFKNLLHIRGNQTTKTIK